MTTESAAVIALATASNGPIVADLGARPFVMVPDGYSVKSVEDTLLQPARARGCVEVRDSASFIALTNELAGPALRVYCTMEPPRFTAVVNDSTSQAGPGWGDHTISYPCPLSVEWRAWMAANKRAMNQVEFAQFIEDNLPDVVSPTAAEMLEVSRTLIAKKKVNFVSAVRLDNGQHQCVYEETVSGSAGAKGQFAVPEVFTLGISVFEGGPAYAVRARLRYRITDGGTLSLWFDLERPHKIIQDAMSVMLEAIKAGLGVPVINGQRA